MTNLAAQFTDLFNARPKQSRIGTIDHGPRYYTIGHYVRYKRSEVLAWLAKQAVEPEAVA